MPKIETNRSSSDSGIREPLPTARLEATVFCLPYAGASPHVFNGWKSSFDRNIRLTPIALPGRGPRRSEPLATRVLPLARWIADDVTKSIGSPFVLFGHSMGGIIAFEVARELRRRGSMQPRHLFVSGCCAPQWPEKRPNLSQMQEDEFIEELRRLNGTPREVLNDPEMMAILAPTLRADFEMIDTYQYQSEAPLPYSMTVYGGLEDPDVPEESLYAWGKETSSTLAVRLFPGDHFFIHHPHFPSMFRSDIDSLMLAQ